MRNLRGIEVGSAVILENREFQLVFTEDSDKSLHLLSQFLVSHPLLTSIILENLKIEQTTAITSFLRFLVALLIYFNISRILVSMASVKELLLKNFEFPMSMDPVIIRNFV